MVLFSPFPFSPLLLLVNQNHSKPTDTNPNFFLTTLSPTHHPPWFPSTQASQYSLFHYIYFFPLKKLSYSLPPRNIEKGWIVHCGAPTSHICITRAKAWWKIPSLWKQVHITAPFIKMVPTKSKPNLELSLINILSHPSPPISLIISSQNPWKYPSFYSD